MFLTTFSLRHMFSEVGYGTEIITGSACLARGAENVSVLVPLDMSASSGVDVKEKERKR